MAKTIDETKQTDWKIFLRFTLVPIALFFLFKKLFFELFTSTFVKYIFSKVSEPSTETDIAAIFICFVVVIFFAPKILKGAVIPNKWLYLTLTYCITYFSFRIDPSVENSKLQFIAFKNHPNIYLSDLTIVIPLILGFFVFIHYDIKPQLPLFKVELPGIDTAKGFTVEEPTIIKTDDDLLGRSKFIESLANQIRNTKTDEGSFPIGISASWGSGKTTFLKSLLNQFESDKNFVIIELNVWKAGTPNLIIETLFKELREKLKDYSFTLNNKLPEYASNLTKVSKEGFETFKTLTELAFPTQSLEKQFETISKAIKATNKKIIISIDDLDRLDKKEVYEVIRLIRNTANFANTFFIVTYDRNYILEAIADINLYKSHTFLEKIFQLEFSLPPAREVVIKRAILKDLTKVLEEESFEVESRDTKILKNLLNPQFYDSQEKYLDLTSKYILTMRDVTRFVNSFKLIYKFVKGEVYFVDLYNLELIRFKHPEIYSEFYRHSKIFFDNAIKQKDSKETIVSSFVDFLTKNIKNYKINEAEVELIRDSLDELFNEEAFLKSNNNLLSVTKPSMFDRYFFFEIFDSFSDKNFSEIRKLENNEFIGQVKEICKRANIIDDVVYKFQSIREFDNEKDFEKIVKGIVEMINLPNPNKKNDQSLNKNILFSVHSFSEIISCGQKNNFYKDKEPDFLKNSIKELLQNRDSYSTYLFISEILREISLSNYGSFILSSDELSDLLFYKFKDRLKDNLGSLETIYKFFNLCKKIHSTEIGKGQTVSVFRIREDAKELMCNYIVENRLDDFFKETDFYINEVTGKLKLGDSNSKKADKINEFFGNYKNFIVRLIAFEGESKYRDAFIEFHGDELPF